MKNFRNLKMTLFDSTNASFKLGIEATFTRKNNLGNYTPLVFVSDQGYGQLNPNIFVTFANKNEAAKPLYTSYPQIHRFRKAFSQIEDLLNDPSSFTEIDGVMHVSQKAQEPIILSGIGKESRWVALKITMIAMGDNGVTTSMPGVTIEISDTNSETFVSILSVEEFLTVATIIADLNLTTLQACFSIAYLQADEIPQQQFIPQAPMTYPSYPQPPQYQNPAPQYPTHQYNPQSYTGQPPRQVNNSQPPRQRAFSNTPAPQPPIEPAYQQQNQTSKMPPRSEGRPLVNMQNVEETDVSEVSFNDLSAIDDIFNT